MLPPPPIVRFNEPQTFEREGDARIYTTHLQVSCACFLQTHSHTLHSSLALILISISWGFTVTSTGFYVQRCYNTDWWYTLKISRRPWAESCVISAFQEPPAAWMHIEQFLFLRAKFLPKVKRTQDTLHVRPRSRFSQQSVHEPALESMHWHKRSHARCG